MGPAFIQRLLGGVHNVLGGGKIRLTDFQVNDTLALRLQRAGTDEDVESRLHSDALHSFRKFHRFGRSLRGAPGHGNPRRLQYNRLHGGMAGSERLRIPHL